MPQFIDLSNDAKIAATRGVAGALSSANAENYAARRLEVLTVFRFRIVQLLSVI